MIKKYLKRYFVDAMSYMALGLFSSLIVGLIISQFAKIPHLGILAEFSGVLAASSPVVGGAIGAAIAYGLKSKPLVIFSCIAVGAFGYQLGGPVGAYVSALVANEIASLVAGKTKIDIVVTPIVCIVTGGFVSTFVGPYLSEFMTGFGNLINSATQLHPFPMGITVSVLMGLALTAPISSAAIAIMLGLDGIAAGAAAVGCCAQMIGFAVTSFKANGVGGLLSQGLGTSMLQFGNIMRHPQILIAPTLAGAILGPISTCLLQMTNTPTGAGMGTSGLVGQFGAYSAMSESFGAVKSLLLIILMHFVAPAILSLLIHLLLKKLKIVKDEYLKLDQPE
ncbi:MAG: PTS sugar transporter subunit IIC [Oscillospiraceae bacterium]|nr:PTS sugar transporter subunit IIC [Oscillospiraceae bacterium]MDD6146857.1 PTS sugar transporter subunit IIC [Oscillospiraceae bacterium]